MCHPAVIPIAMMAASAGSAAYGANQQQKQGKELIKNAEEGNAIQQAAVNRKAREIISSQLIDNFERQRQEKRLAAKARTSAASGGVGGSMLLRDIATNEVSTAYDLAVLRTNRTNQQLQNYDVGRGVSTKTQSMINQGESLIGNPFINALQIGAAGFKGYQAGRV